MRKDIVEMETNLEDRRSELIRKGEADFISAVMKLLRIQSNTFLYAVKENTKVMSQNSQGFTQEITNIADALSKINQISSKTKILSINASIEAARAGEMGKGFAVVAVEVGNLSTQTTSCTDEVSGINMSLLKSVDANKTALSQLDNCVSKYEGSGAAVMDTVMRLAAIEENGFILTTLAKRLENHADFMQNVAQNAGKLEKVADHHSCAFGKWFDAHRSEFRFMEEYEDIYSTHEAFHRAAIQFNSTRDIAVLVEFLECSNTILLKFCKLVEAFKRDMSNNERFTFYLKSLA